MKFTRVNIEKIVDKLYKKLEQGFGLKPGKQYGEEAKNFRNMVLGAREKGAAIENSLGIIITNFENFTIAESVEEYHKSEKIRQAFIFDEAEYQNIFKEGDRGNVAILTRHEYSDYLYETLKKKYFIFNNTFHRTDWEIKGGKLLGLTNRGKKKLMKIKTKTVALPSHDERGEPVTEVVSLNGFSKSTVPKHLVQLDFSEMVYLKKIHAESCKNLKWCYGVNITKNNSELSYIGDRAFYNTVLLEPITRLDFSEKLTYLGEQVFGLDEKNMTIKKTLHAVKDRILNKVNLVNTNLIWLGAGAFSGYPLKEVNIIGNENLQEIGARAFSNTISGITLTGSPKLEKVGEYAFKGCLGNSSFEFGEQIPEIGVGAFGYHPEAVNSLEFTPSITDIMVPNNSGTVQYSQNFNPYTKMAFNNVSKSTETLGVLTEFKRQLEDLTYLYEEFSKKSAIYSSNYMLIHYNDIAYDFYGPALVNEEIRATVSDFSDPYLWASLCGDILSGKDYPEIIKNPKEIAKARKIAVIKKKKAYDKLIEEQMQQALVNQTEQEETPLESNQETQPEQEETPLESNQETQPEQEETPLESNQETQPEQEETPLEVNQDTQLEQEETQLEIAKHYAKVIEDEEETPSEYIDQTTEDMDLDDILEEPTEEEIRQTILGYTVVENFEKEEEYLEELEEIEKEQDRLYEEIDQVERTIGFNNSEINSLTRRADSIKGHDETHTEWRKLQDTIYELETENKTHKPKLNNLVNQYNELDAQAETLIMKVGLLKEVRGSTTKPEPEPEQVSTGRANDPIVFAFSEADLAKLKPSNQAKTQVSNTPTNLASNNPEPQGAKTTNIDFTGFSFTQDDLNKAGIEETAFAKINQAENIPEKTEMQPEPHKETPPVNEPGKHVDLTISPAGSRNFTRKRKEEEARQAALKLEQEKERVRKQREDKIKNRQEKVKRQQIELENRLKEEAQREKELEKQRKQEEKERAKLEKELEKQRKQEEKEQAKLEKELEKQRKQEEKEHGAEENEEETFRKDKFIQDTPEAQRLKTQQKKDEFKKTLREPLDDWKAARKRKPKHKKGIRRVIGWIPFVGKKLNRF